MSIPAMQLRAWAKGVYPLEAAVELLILGFDGRFAQQGSPWTQPSNDSGNRYWVNWDQLAYESGALSSGQQRFINIVLSLGSSEHPVDLSTNIAGLDRKHLELVLAGIAHAAGSHDFRTMGERPPTSDGWADPSHRMA